jgi:hypothetical protein
MMTDKEWHTAEMDLRKRFGIIVNADGQVVCKHRSKSCCPKCVAEHDSIVSVSGAEFFVPDPEERKELSA